MRRFQQGKVRVNHKKFTGFDKVENGELVIDETEAGIVRRIFAEYLAGKGCKAIAKGLEADRIPTATGRTAWHESVIKKMLKNEKYAGDALLQKTVMTDFLTHKRVVNDGDVQQYYVENSHPAIVSKETFQAVQIISLVQVEFVLKSGVEVTEIVKQPGSVYLQQGDSRFDWVYADWPLHKLHNRFDKSQEARNPRDSWLLLFPGSLFCSNLNSGVQPWPELFKHSFQ